MSERIDVAKLREQFTLWPEVLHVLDALEAAHDHFHLIDAASPQRRERLLKALEQFDFGDA